MKLTQMLEQLLLLPLLLLVAATVATTEEMVVKRKAAGQEAAEAAGEAALTDAALCQFRLNFVIFLFQLRQQNGHSLLRVVYVVNNFRAQT